MLEKLYKINDLESLFFWREFDFWRSGKRPHNLLLSWFLVQFFAYYTYTRIQIPCMKLFISHTTWMLCPHPPKPKSPVPT